MKYITALTVIIFLLSSSCDAFCAQNGRKTGKIRAKKSSVQQIAQNTSTVMINGVEWIFRTDSMEFDDGEWNQKAKLAAGRKIKLGAYTVNLSKDTPVSFFKDGSLQSGQIDGKLDTGKMKFAGSITFTNDGQIEKGFLAENASYKGLTLRSQREIFFHSSGAGESRVKKTTLASETKIGEETFGRDCELTLADSDEIKVISARTLSDERIGAYRFRRGTDVKIHETTGRIKSGVISVNSLINGKIYPPNTFIEFDENGTLVKAVIQNGENR